MNRTSCSRAALILGGALLLHPSPAHWLVRAAEPYLRYRDLSLGYTGPDEARTNLAEIRIAWFGPSDPLDRTAGGMWWAASRAVREANEAGGYRESAAGEGRPFRLIPSWSTNVWGAGVAQLARLVYEAEPVALVGSIDSATTHLAEQVVAKANLPLVSPVTTDQSITLAGVSWMFACAPSDPVIARVLVQHLVTGLSSNRDKVVVVNTTDHESRMQAREVLKALNLHQLTPQFRFEVLRALAITAQLRALAPFRPATVLVVASAEDSARLVRAIREGAPIRPTPGTVADRTSTHREDDQAAASASHLGHSSHGLRALSRSGRSRG
ncbi:MAG: ABC transporter substrate-binding protein [Verrucomicrobiota bacterium]